MPLCLELTGKETEGLQCARSLCRGFVLGFVVAMIAVEIQVVQAWMWTLTKTELQPHHSLSCSHSLSLLLCPLNHEQDLPWQTFQVYLMPMLFS